MREKKFTLGPWYTYECRDNIGCKHTISTVKTEDEESALVEDWENNGEAEGVADCPNSSVAGIWSTEPVDQANAHLISAAPELLDALEYALEIIFIVEDVLNSCGISVDVDMIEQAIAKAYGESS